MQCLVCKKKDLKVDSKFYREPVQWGKDRGDMIPFLVPVKNLAAAFWTIWNRDSVDWGRPIYKELQ